MSPKKKKQQQKVGAEEPESQVEVPADPEVEVPVEVAEREKVAENPTVEDHLEAAEQTPHQTQDSLTDQQADASAEVPQQEAAPEEVPPAALSEQPSQNAVEEASEVGRADPQQAAIITQQQDEPQLRDEAPAVDFSSEEPAPHILVSHDPLSPALPHAADDQRHTEPHLSKIHVLELLEPVQEELANMARAMDDTTSTVNLRMDRLNVELYNIRQEQSASEVKFGTDLASATQHLTTIFVERLNAEQKSWESTTGGLNQRIEECYDVLSASLEKDVARLEKSVMESVAANANAVATHAELMQTQVDALVAQCNSTMAVLTQNVHELHEMVAKALTKEILPPGPDIPDGPKIRLVVTFSAGGKQPTDVMVPISINATIGMVKREIIRRLSRQNLVGDAVTYSNSILSLDGVVLFEDDTLDDVGITANERMTLGLVGGSSPSAGNGSVPQAQLSPKLVPPPSIKAPERPPSAGSPPVAPSDSDRVVRSFFLDASTAASLAEHESLDRRLMIEMARMELEPMAQQERLERVAIVKAQVNKLRVTLLDRATYSHVEAHRAMARSALEKLNDSTARPTVSVDDLRGAQKLAEATLASISSTTGERDRVDAMNEAIRAESGKKTRLLQEIKDLIFEIRHRLRIPADLLTKAEKVIDEGERAIILAPSMTSKELDEIHLLMVDFASALKK
jgi:hypothetical protein